MKVAISEEAEIDLKNGFWFYENQELGLGQKFRESLKSEIRSLVIYGGSHPIRNGYQRMVCKSFPYFIYYKLITRNSLLIVAVFSQRRGKDWITKRLG